MHVDYRRLTKADASPFRETRLAAFKAHPEAFGSSFDEFAQKPLEDFEAWLEEMVTFGAFSDGQLVGIGAYFRENGKKMEHRGYVISMFVDPSVRGQGIARQIIELLCIEAKQNGIIQLHLGVGATNQSAIKSYKRAGFTTYGTEPRSLYVNGQYIDEELMVRFLDEAPRRTEHE